MTLLPKTKALFVVLAVILLANFINVESSSELQPLPSIPVMTKDEITKVELSTATEKIVLEKIEGVWNVTSPFKAKADKARVKSLILNFRKEIPMDAHIDTNDLETYGLQAGNAIIVEMWTNSPQPTASFLIGNDSSYGATFVRMSGNESIYRARLGGRRRYAHTASEWQNQEVFDFNIEEFQSLLVNPKDGNPYQIIRDNEWKIEPQIDGEVEQDRVDRSVKSLTMLRIGKRDNDFQLEAEVTFEMSSMNGQTIRLISSKPEAGSVHVRLEGSEEIYRVASPAIERFLQGASWFKDRRMVKMNPRQEFDMLRLHTTSLDVVIQQDLSTGFWKVLQPNNLDLDMRQIFFMVNTLASLEATKQKLDKNQYSSYFNEPPIFVDIRTLMGEVKTLQFSEPIEIEGEKGHLCRDKQADLIFMVSLEDVEKIVTGFGQANFFNSE
jgi:hypothetical protein